MKKIILSLFLTVPHIAFTAINQDCYESCPFYLFAQAGESFSRCTKIEALAPIWDPAVEGYNASLGRAPMFGLGFGVYMNEWLSLSFAVNHRSRFKYRKLQHVQPEFLSSVNIGTKTRFFDFDNTSFMVNLRADYEFCPECVRGPQLTWKPYASVGIGLSKNSLYNFHSVQEETLTVDTFQVPIVASIMTPNVINKFAWQGEFGMEASLCQKLFIGLGYRYFNGNHFFSNDFLVETRSARPSPIVIPPWKGTFATQELVVSFSINF